ncbi:unconventional myosin-VIIa-like isoform X2 [Harmonia axyridis]|uniref:unconventional myosin-VIIa-like isoform X2 n=1 Tax=Harmonia axyridis TaxID=115357 RepID=UPI001E277707|nr:unconventional myosin-VIIa-like isoform X2 [Harmonia axyridis]
MIQKIPNFPMANEVISESQKLNENLIAEESNLKLLNSNSEDIFPLNEEDTKQFYFIDNICDLKLKSPQNVTKLIKYRFFRKLIYTWAGQTLIAVQPYDNNYKNQDEKEGEPNVSTVVDRAFFKLSNKLGKTNQIIVISGDSGSGKTYSGCLALKYLAFQHSSHEDKDLRDILTRTCSAVTVLAAFGNASTIHNFNSSRFGKLTQMQCREGKFVGAYIQTYLLEKSRVSGPNKGESNFHIFTQVLEDLDDYVLEKLYLSKTTEYVICPRMIYHRKTSFSDVVEMMSFLNIKEIDDVLHILSLILNLGNIIFTCKDEKLVILQECKQYVNFCALIFQTSSSSLTQLFTKRLIAPKLRRGSLCYTSCVNIEECNERRNSLMRFLYEKLFMWLVEKINEQTYYRKKHDCLGILDIYGFETFAHNTFEQLCINYANERLQQFYMTDYYNKQVNYLYEKCEKVTKYDMSKYNKRINLLDGTLSVFGILNEECLVKRYNTDMFISTRLSNCLRKNEFFIDRKDYTCTKFSIKHYAGVVEYDSRSMVSKNRDKLPEEMVLFLKETKLAFLSKILDFRDEEVQISHNKTLLSKFKKSLDNLMVSLSLADTHYIKCLKPNQKQLPNSFDDYFFMAELQYNGIIDTLNLEFQRFSTVLSKEDFSKKFDLDILEKLKGLLEGKVYVGRDKIYFSDGSFSLILKYKMILITSCVKIIQRSWKARSRKRHIAACKIQRRFFLNNNTYSTIDSLNTTLDQITVIENVHLEPDLIVETEVKPIKAKRCIFRGDRIISRFKIAQIPIRFHIRRTCIPYSHVLPIDEMPKGLKDIF